MTILRVAMVLYARINGGGMQASAADRSSIVQHAVLEHPGRADSVTLMFVRPLLSSTVRATVSTVVSGPLHCLSVPIVHLR